MNISSLCLDVQLLIDNCNSRASYLFLENEKILEVVEKYLLITAVQFTQSCLNADIPLDIIISELSSKLRFFRIGKQDFNENVRMIETLKRGLYQKKHPLGCPIINTQSFLIKHKELFFMRFVQKLNIRAINYSEQACFSQADLQFDLQQWIDKARKCRKIYAVFNDTIITVNIYYTTQQICFCYNHKLFKVIGEEFINPTGLEALKYLVNKQRFKLMRQFLS